MAESYEAHFGAILADIEAEMRAVRRAQREVAPLFWEIVDYQFGWDRDGTGENRRGAGKKIRPVLMALVAQAVTGDYRHVLPAGVALEFLHNFTLIHDDVMDRSLERRHRPAVWARWGSVQAINAGDGLYALANLAVPRLRDAGIDADQVMGVGQILSQACLWTAEGQILDMDFEAREQVTPDEYLTMVVHKTGALIEAATQIGAFLSTDDEALVTAFAAFGRHLGIAFQVRDDYLGAWGDEGKTGKSATGDIREKKKSFPVLVAFERATASDRQRLVRLYAQPTLSDEDVRTVLTILEAVGAAEETERVAEQHTRMAREHLESTGLDGAALDPIRQFVAFLLHRTY